jgi:eukaryotic-like serine/threonine-protein kinase
VGDSADDEARFRRRADELGLARTLGLPLDATITARTLAAAPASATQPLITAPDLPHISVDGREAAGGEPSSASPRSRRDYAITATLGEGGMGRVQLARQRSLDRDVALKTLKPGAPPALAGALLREARLTGALEHPGVIPVHALGLDDDGHPMLVMKRIDGVDLSVMLDDPDNSAWRSRSANRLVAGLEILMQVCLTVEFAHSRGVIHRDIKPENIMVGSFGEVYLLDWGIAATAGDGDARTLVGTPVYLAPEMVLGESISPRTDVYLLGATLHHLLTGRARHDGTTVMEVLHHAALSAPFAYDDTIPDELARLCNRATARRPEDRPASAAELREAIANFLRHKSARALCEAALERLAALEKILEAAPSGVPADLTAAYRLATEARFGLVQSLREHSSDDGTRRAMRRCLIATIELELRQSHADTAEILARELDPSDAAITQRIAEAHAAASERAREHARLEKLDADLDPSQHAAARSRIMFWSAVCLVGISIAVLQRRKPSPQVAMVASLGGLGVIGGAILMMRRRLFGHAFNRRVAMGLLVAIGGIVIHRVLNLLRPGPIEQVLQLDLLMMTGFGAMAAVTLLPGLALVALTNFTGVVAIELRPDEAPLIFGVVSTITFVMAGVVLARAKSDRRST